MQKELLENNLILKLSFDFSLRVIEYCEKLEQEKKYIIARQLLKSGTSIGANAMEAQNPESKPDFIHKIKIAAKEADETQYWLYLCEHSKKYPDCKVLVEKLEEIQKVLNKILGTAKKRNPFSYFLSFFIF
ncbi:MAG: four helix bundle protein [Sphingobacteriales bacterium]|nr:four helix bundle protein [Sphingobacteriales bacterium]